MILEQCVERSREPAEEPPVSAKGRLYRIFGLALESNIELPELPRVEGRRGDYRFSLQAPADTKPLEQARSHQWRDPDGNVAIVSAATDDGYLLRFPDIADFFINRIGTSIRCRPTPSTSVRTVRHLLLDQVMPRAVAHQGNLVLHASAALIPTGCACFVGPSGAGKSTLASSFQTAGYRLLADDAVWLRPENGDIFCVPSYEGARLWPGSLERLQLSGMSHRLVSGYSDKKRLIPRSESAPINPTPLAALFVLTAPMDGKHATDIVTEPIYGAGNMVELIKQAFVLDVKNRQHTASHFNLLGRIVDAHIRMYRLSYPRDFEQLSEVRTHILRTLEREY